MAAYGEKEKAGGESDQASPTTLAYLTVSAPPIPPISLPSYMACAHVGRKLSAGIGFIAMSLAYGTERSSPAF